MWQVAAAAAADCRPSVGRAKRAKKDISVKVPMKEYEAFASENAVTHPSEADAFAAFKTQLSGREPNSV